MASEGDEIKSREPSKRDRTIIILKRNYLENNTQNLYLDRRAGPEASTEKEANPFPLKV